MSACLPPGGLLACLPVCLPVSCLQVKLERVIQAKNNVISFLRMFFIAASNQIASRILQFVNDSFLDQYYQKALESLKKLREESIKVCGYRFYNQC